jgi:hypothetical protein
VCTLAVKKKSGQVLTCRFGPILVRGRGWDGVDWIDMAQDIDQWGALVNKVLNLRVP